MKKISVNPDYLKISRRGSKEKKKKKEKLSNSLKPNRIKRDLIKRIKEHNNKLRDKEKQNKLKNKNKDFENDFENTLQYLDKITKKNKEKKKKKRKNKTMKNQPFQQQQQPFDNNMEHQYNQRFKIPNAPPYGILKNGKKPTYRTYNKTLKKNTSFSENITPINIHNSMENNIIENNFMNNMNIKSEREKKLEKLKKKLKPKKNKVYTKRLRRRITLGKKNGSIGVMIKNNKTRRAIKNEHIVLKNKDISEVKEYLKKHNLIKIGTSAPENILRQLYESAYLSGNIINKNPNILLHNWETND